MTTTRAPGARRAPARDADTPAEEPVAEAGWRVRARQWLQGRADAASARAKHVLLAAAIAAMDKGIASLQGLRQRVAGAEPADERRDRERERPGNRATRKRSEDQALAEEAVAPKPRRRLRGLLVYMSVILAGGMGGMALAYDLLAQLLDQRAAESKRQEVKMSKYANSVAGLEKKLDQQQAKQIEAETRLAAALAENEKKLGELQAQRAEAETRLASAITGRASNPQQGVSSNRVAARRGPAAWTTGNCTLGSGNVRSALNGCIADMNRK